MSGKRLSAKRLSGKVIVRETSVKIPNCAEVIAPLTELTKYRAPNNVEWGSEQETTFKEVKKILSSELILKLPDLNREIILSTDASNKSLDACVMQEYDGVG